MTTHQRNPYTGTKKSLVIGIDIGTTFSGVSYAMLKPGEVPQIYPVVRFTGQKGGKLDSKVPSVVCYNKKGHVVAVGPETDPEVNLNLSEVVWRAEWFKLRLKLPYLVDDERARLEQIWSGEQLKTPVQVFADFLQYLFTSAQEYITETEKHIDSNFKWSSIASNTHFVLAHPNGWEKEEQSQMRKAVIAAKLVDKSTAERRITFVTEGEASLHFCLDMNPELLQERGGLLVVDSGGGTIDLSAYSQTENGRYEEIVSPDCLLQGSIFVTSRARRYFKDKLRGSKFGTDDDLETMARSFDKPEGAKCLFHDPNAPYFVQFGGIRDHDVEYGIYRGRFKVEGAQMAEFFKPAIEAVIGSIINQCKNTKGVSIRHVLLVGGFGKSHYLHAQLRDYFDRSGRGIIFVRPDHVHLQKAVATGAVSYYVRLMSGGPIKNDDSGGRCVIM